MLQSISSVNVNNKVSATPIRQQSFGNSYAQPKKPSAVGWAAGQFATGAAVSLIFDAVFAGYYKLAQKPQTPISQVLGRAGLIGVAFLGMGLLFEGINAHRRNKQM